MSDHPTWMRPSEAANSIHKVRADGVGGFGYGLLKRKLGGATTSSLAFSKLNPIKPDANSPRTRCGWPATSRDHRLLLARGAADPLSIERLFADYDLATPDHQQILAAVFTIPFDRDRPLHDSFDAVLAWAMLDVGRAKHLTSLVVLHAANDQLSDLSPHAHVQVLCRQHYASGWASVEDDFNEDAHSLWADRWSAFDEAWRRKAE